jgi:hypothetical protein
MTETKRCYACGETKPVSEFYRSNKVYYQKECKTCNRERKYKWHQTEQGKRSSANTKLKARFGITIDEYEAMYEQQGGKCLCCGDTESYLGHRLAVDHCHETGKIRGLLCKSCNVGLGNLKENKQFISNLLKYVENYCDPLKGK